MSPSVNAITHKNLSEIDTDWCGTNIAYVKSQRSVVVVQKGSGLVEHVYKVVGELVVTIIF